MYTGIPLRAFNGANHAGIQGNDRVAAARKARFAEVGRRHLRRPTEAENYNDFDGSTSLH